MKKIFSIVAIIVSVCCLFTSCKQEDKGDPPALPGLQSMTIDFSYFNTAKSASKGVSYYYETAAEIATVWVPIVNQTLATPIAALKTFSSQNASSGTFVEESTWKWSFTSGNSSVEAVGVIGPSNIAWTVTIGDFVWVTGTSNVEGTSGTWNINESASNPTKLLQIDWATSGTTASSIKYTSGSNNITFTPTATDAAYNSSLNGTHNSEAFSIEWNATAGGRVKCFAEFGDNEWKVWDANKANV